MKSLNQITIVMVCLAVLGGCKQNPYQAIKPGETVGDKKSPEQKEASSPFSVEAPDSIECTEGSTCSAEIRGHVPEPGNAQLQFEGLPDGATYDATTGIFTYVPSYNVVDVAAHPDKSSIIIPMTVIVRSSADSITVSHEVISIEVKNKMQAVDLVVTGSPQVDEGKILEQLVEVKSADFPQGPFSLAVVGAPSGTEVVSDKGNPNQFLVRFKPNYLTVKGKNYNNFPVNYNVSLPVGSSVTKTVSWRVNDIRQSPVILAPTEITQGLDVGFSIRAEDMNGEALPQVTVKTNVPFGRIASTTVLESQGADVSFPSKTVQVRWDQLKVSNLGTTTAIEYEVCVKKATSNNTNCFQKQVMVTLKADLHPAPKLDRSAWEIGDLKFFRAGVPMSFRLPILDAEDFTLPVDVSIVSNQLNSVTWRNGTLTVNPQSEGILQFNITAQSIFGQSVSEGFVVEVLPSSWAKTVILMSNSVQNESMESAKLISSVELLSAQFQVSKRNLSLRESCMLTTDAFATAKIDEKIQDSIYQNVSSILISTPLADQVKGKIQSDLRAFGIGIKGRLSQVLPGVDISAMTLVADSKSSLESPSVPAGLKGALTPESKDPLVFDLDQLSSACMPLFSLQKPAASLAVGVSCSHEGKTLTILGFELADVLLSPKDAPLLSKWMNVLLTGKGK